jgi:hypothetical protein
MCVCPDVVSVARHLVLTALLPKTEDAVFSGEWLPLLTPKMKVLHISKCRSLLTQRHTVASQAALK